MQAIITKVLPPTAKRPARVMAYCPQGKVTISVLSESPSIGHHHLAVKLLCLRMKWYGWLCGGTLEQGKIVWVRDSYEGGRILVKDPKVD